MFICFFELIFDVCYMKFGVNGFVNVWLVDRSFECIFCLGGGLGVVGLEKRCRV